MTEALLALAASPWALLILGLACYLDSLLPPVPSETFVIALAALAAAGHGPHPGLVVGVAAAGALLGDRTAYEIGARMPRGGGLLRGRRAARLAEWARRMLEQRGAAFILSARYVPVGRVAVNVAAGAVGYPARRFTAVAALSSVLWAGYSTLLGAGAGAVLAHQPLLAVAVGVVLGVGLGLVV